MRGRFDDALTTSLSSQGAHQETLRRIEQYSITSMRSSTRSLRSMDSLRSELSRLEAMITSSQTASSWKIDPSRESLPMPTSGQRGRDNVTHKWAATSQRFGTSQDSFASRPCEGSSNMSRYSSEISDVRQPRAQNRINVHTHPADYQFLVKEQEDISKRFSEISSGHESALLYAQFSRSTSPIHKSLAKPSRTERSSPAVEIEGKEQGEEHHLKTTSTSSHLSHPREVLGHPHRLSQSNMEWFTQSARTSISQRTGDRSSSSYDQSSNLKPEANSSTVDPSSMYTILQQSLVETQPPLVAQLLSLQDLALLHTNHINLLENGRNALLDTPTHEDSHHTQSIQLHLRKLRAQLETLQIAIDDAARRCAESGHNISELRSVHLPARSGSLVQIKPKEHCDDFGRTQNKGITRSRDSGDFSDGSDIYFSSEE